VAQHDQAVGDLAEGAATSTRTIAAALRRLDPELLRLRNGRVDLAAFDSFNGPLTSVQDALTQLRATVRDVESPWLVAPLADRSDALDTDIAANEEPL